MNSLSPRRHAYRLIALQAGAAGVISAAWILAGLVFAASAFLGGVVAVLPNFYFAIRFFAHTSPRHADHIIRTFYWGEVTKLLFSAALAVAIFKLWPGITPLPFFSGFIAAYFGLWFTPFVMRKK